MFLRTNFIDEVLSSAHIIFNATAEQKLPVSLPELLNLCGGVPSPKVTGLNIEISATYLTAFSVKMECDQYEATRNIDFSIGRLDNNFLHVFERGEGLGTNLFLNQFRMARKLGFRRIHLAAMAPDYDLDWTGYYFWACLGFENADIEEFQTWAKAMNRDEETLSDLMQTDEGRAAWKANGFTWIGDFFLTDGHGCYQYLTTHLERKGIEFTIE